MAERDTYMGGAHRHALYGDIYPSNASYTDPLLTQELLKLYYRNEFVQLMTDWMTAEAFRNWIRFVEDTETITGLKFGNEYPFKGYEYEDEETGKITKVTPFCEYMQWNDVPQMLKRGVSWSRLYSQGSLLVFLDDDDDLLKQSEKDDGIIQWGANTNAQGYSRFTVFQPIQAGVGTGFTVAAEDEDGANADGTVKTWKVHMHTKYMKSAKTFLIDADRCIHLLWKKRENGWDACSRVAPFAHIAKMEEQTFKKLSKRAHDIAGGILHIDGVSSAAEQSDLDNAMGSDLTSVDRIYTKEGRTVEYKTPDLKAAGEFSTIFEMYTKKLCRYMRISQLVLDGEHTGASLGGNDNAETMNSYTEIYEIQEHYRNPLEKIFYKLGKENTSFVYRELLPEEMRVDQQNTEAMYEHENDQLDQTLRSADAVDKRDGGSNGNESESNNNEQTR